MLQAELENNRFTFLKEGKTVVFSDINQEKLDQVVADYTKEGYDAFSVVCDVTKEVAINAAIDTVVEKYGRIDILVNNAGLQHVAMIEDFPTEKFEFMIKIMLTAPFIAIKRAFPTMKAQKHGRIINMASINGVIGFAGKSAYNSAKHGLIGLTKVTALEAADSGITVNAICPGYVDTPLVRGQFEDLSKTRGIPLKMFLKKCYTHLFLKNASLTFKKLQTMCLSLPVIRQKVLQVKPVS